MKKILVGMLACVAMLGAFALDDVALPPGGDFYGVGGTATTQLGGALIVPSTASITGAVTIGSTLTAGGAIDGVPADTSVAVAGAAWDADTYGQVIKKVITVTNCTVILEDSKADGNGVKIIDLAEGIYEILGAIADMTVINNGAFNASANDLYYISCGTAAAADADADLTSTEADIIPKTTIDTASGAELTNNFHAVLASATLFNGAATASDIYVNCSVADASSSGIVTNKITGTLTLYMIKLGDY